MSMPFLQSFASYMHYDIDRRTDMFTLVFDLVRLVLPSLTESEVLEIVNSRIIYMAKQTSNHETDILEAEVCSMFLDRDDHKELLRHKEKALAIH